MRFSPSEIVPQQPPVRRRGRPPGAKNKKTEELRAYLERTGQMPTEYLASIYRANTAELATKLGAKKHEVVKMQVAAASALLPYTEAKVTADMNVQQNIAPVMLVSDETARAMSKQGVIVDNDGGYSVAPPVVLVCDDE